MVNRYVFLHKMDNLFIDLKHKCIFYKMKQRREPILRMMDGSVKSYSLDDECYEQLVALLRRKESNSDDIGGRISSMESNLKSLELKIDGLKSSLDKIIPQSDEN